MFIHYFLNTSNGHLSSKFLYNAVKDPFKGNALTFKDIFIMLPHDLTGYIYFPSDSVASYFSIFVNLGCRVAVAIDRHSRSIYISYSSVSLSVRPPTLQLEPLDLGPRIIHSLSC